MFKPSPQLQGRVRLRFTTKQVAGGFYRGSRTGAMGAHTEWGGYVIDWRKTRRYVVPDLTGFKLTPFVSQAIPPTPRVEETRDYERYIPPRVDAMEYLRRWRRENPLEYSDVKRNEEAAAQAAVGEETQINNS